MFIRVCHWDDTWEELGPLAYVNADKVQAMEPFRRAYRSLPDWKNSTLILSDDRQYYAAHPVERVEEALSLFWMKLAREATEARMPLPGFEGPQNQIRTWCLDLSKPAQIELVEMEADISDPRMLRTPTLAIPIKRNAL